MRVKSESNNQSVEIEGTIAEIRAYQAGCGDQYRRIGSPVRLTMNEFEAVLTSSDYWVIYNPDGSVVISGTIPEPMRQDIERRIASLL